MSPVSSSQAFAVKPGLLLEGAEKLQPGGLGHWAVLRQGWSSGNKNAVQEQCLNAALQLGLS